MIYFLGWGVENYVDGAEFVSLTEEEIKGMVPPLGLFKKILKLRPKVH